MRKVLSCPSIIVVAAFLVCLPGLAGAQDAAPAEIAVRFLRAFEQKDFATVRLLLTDDATIVRTVLSRTAAPEVRQFSARAWADEAERTHAYLRDLQLDLLETAESRIDQGAVVSLRYRFTGKAGNTPFVSDGIDTYSMIPVQGQWRILQYSYIERLEMLPTKPGGEQ